MGNWMKDDFGLLDWHYFYIISPNFRKLLNTPAYINIYSK